MRGQPPGPRVLAPTPVLRLLSDAVAAAGAGPTDSTDARRLYQVIADAFPAELPPEPAALLASADARPVALEQLLAAAGLTDYQELLARAATEEDRRLASPDARYGARLSGRPSSAQELLERLFRAEQENLTRTLDALRRDGALELAARTVLSARRRFLVGSAKAGAYAQLLASELAASMSNVTLVGEGGTHALDALCDVRAGDALVAFSFRRYSPRTLAVATEFAAAGGAVVAVTDDAASPLAAVADVALVATTSSASYTDSPTAVAAVIHALATLSAAGAKGARRRLERRERLAGALQLYQDRTEQQGPARPEQNQSRRGRT